MFVCSCSVLPVRVCRNELCAHLMQLGVSADRAASLAERVEERVHLHASTHDEYLQLVDRSKHNATIATAQKAIGRLL